MVDRQKHSSCSLKDKLEVLEWLDKGESATTLAAEFSIGKAMISDWKKIWTKIEQFCGIVTEKVPEKRRMSKISEFDKVDEALFLWFSQHRQRGVSLSGSLIQEKALQLSKIMNIDSKFTASNG